MIKKVFIISFFAILCLACNTIHEPASQIPFDKTKWNTKEGKDYPYRNQMVDEVLYSDSLRTLRKNEIINHLGEPSYIREDFYYYRVRETRLGAWILHTKTIVIKIPEGETVKWIKLHE